jgi:NitT/TauT family transport system substrate-binding protein
VLKRHSRHFMHAALAACCIFGVLVSAAPSFAADVISIATIRGAAAMRWPLHIAAAKGMFAAVGIEPQFNEVLFASNIAQDVASGSLDMGSVGLIEPVRASAKGAGVAIIREEGILPPFALMAKPSIKTIADLKGKTVSLGGVADSTRIYFERMLASAHLNLSQVDKVYAGSTADRFAQLKSGAVDAALLLPPFDSLAESSGFLNLANTKDYVKDLPFSGYMVNSAWANAHKDLVKRFLAAYQKAVDWFYDKNNRAEAISIIMHLQKGDPKVIGATYDTLYKLQYFAKTSAVPKRHLENLIAVVKELTGPFEHPVKPEQLVLPGITDYVAN